ncbi:MAG TPA: hypothetical protein DER60_08170 [Syntrophomonas sp.]|jgi:hypothetical protein|nr:hypothetical protein [Syntrophomonas sp.]
MLDLSYFNYCPMQQHPVLGMICRGCQYLEGTEDDCRCTYEEQPETEGYLIKDIISRLLDCLEAGQKSLSKADILSLLEDQNGCQA